MNFRRETQACTHCTGRRDRSTGFLDRRIPTPWSLCSCGVRLQKRKPPSSKRGRLRPQWYEEEINDFPTQVNPSDEKTSV